MPRPLVGADSSLVPLPSAPSPISHLSLSLTLCKVTATAHPYTCVYPHHLTREIRKMGATLPIFCVTGAPYLSRYPALSSPYLSFYISLYLAPI